MAAAAAGAGSGAAARGRAVQRSRVDQLYFESYSYFDIHREMLGDKVSWLGGRQWVLGDRLGARHSAVSCSS